MVAITLGTVKLILIYPETYPRDLDKGCQPFMKGNTNIGCMYRSAMDNALFSNRMNGSMYFIYAEMEGCESLKVDVGKWFKGLKLIPTELEVLMPIKRTSCGANI